MKLIPHDSLILQTADPLHVVQERLADQVEAPKAVRWAWSRNHRPYQGTLSSTGFEIQRIIHYRNSFLPQIRGRFEAVSGGTVVRITMGLHPFIAAFLALWMLGWYGFSLPAFLLGGMPLEAALIFLGMPLVLLVAFWGAFWGEVHHSRREMTQIITGQLYYPTGQGHARSPQLHKQALFLLIGLAAFIGYLSLENGIPEAPSPVISTAQVCPQTAAASPYCGFETLQTLSGHPTVAAIALSPDGQTLVSGGRDKALRVWDVQTGELRQTLQSDSGEVRSVAIAPDGTTVVSGSGDRMVRIWNLETGQPQILKGHEEDVNWVGIAPDGQTVLSASYGAVKRWDLVTGELLTTLPGNAPSEIHIGPLTITGNDPNRFVPRAISADQTTAILNFIGGRTMVWDLVTNQPKFPLKHIGGYVESAHLSPDGQIAVVQYQSPWSKTVLRMKIWDVTTGEAIAQAAIARLPNAIAHPIPMVISQDKIVGIDQQQGKVWNLHTAELEATFATEWFHHPVINSDGTILAGVDNRYSDNDVISVLQR